MRIGIVCPELRRHLDPTLALARELSRRGQGVTVIAASRVASRVEEAGLGFRAIGASEDADGSSAAAWAASVAGGGAAGARAAARAFADLARVHARDLPSAVDAVGCEGLVVDESCPAAASVAEERRLPYVVACPTLFGSATGEAPPPALSLRIAAGRLARWRNLAAARVTRRVVEWWAQRRGPAGVLPLDLVFAPDRGLARVTPMPQFFDAPRRVRAARLHYTGPWSRPARAERAAAEGDPPPGAPVVVVRVGTPGRRTRAVLEALDGAARAVRATVVLGRGAEDGAVAAEAPAAWPRAPAARVLARASVLVTDADLDLALEGLAAGVPAVCVPSCLDQPGVARRVERLGAGLVVPASRADPDRLAAALGRALADPALRDRAAAARRSLALVHGVRLAADVVERALTEGRPVAAPGAAPVV